MWPTTPPDRAPRRLAPLVATVTGLGAVAAAGSVAWLAGLFTPPPATPSWPALAAYLAVLTASDVLSVRVRIRSTIQGVDWTDAVMLVGLATLPVPWVVLAAGVAVLIAKSVRRVPPVKVVFGAAKNMVVALVGGLVLLAVPGQAGLGWLVLAFVVLTLVDLLLVVPVLARASGTSVTERLRSNGDIRLVALAARLAVALAAVMVLERAPTLVYAVPLLVLLAHVWHEQWVRTREERRAWQELAAATASFAAADLDTLLRNAASAGIRLFSAERLEVELWLHRPRRMVRAGPAGPVFDGDPADAPPEPELPHAHQVPLHGCAAHPDIGVLRLRFRHRVRLSEREQAMLASYASALETAVRNAAGAGQLRGADA